METKMEENTTIHPLTLNGGWDQQVNGHAQRKDTQMEMEKCYREQQEARRREEKRAKRTLRLFCLALALITAGGVHLNYVDGFPVWLAVSVAASGLALLFFVIGWLFGRRYR